MNFVKYIIFIFGLSYILSKEQNYELVNNDMKIDSEINNEKLMTNKINANFTASTNKPGMYRMNLESMQHQPSIDQYDQSVAQESINVMNKEFVNEMENDSEMVQNFGSEQTNLDEIKTESAYENENCCDSVNAQPDAAVIQSEQFTSASTSAASYQINSQLDSQKYYAKKPKGVVVKNEIESKDKKILNEVKDLNLKEPKKAIKVEKTKTESKAIKQPTSKKEGFSKAIEEFGYTATVTTTKSILKHYEKIKNKEFSKFFRALASDLTFSMSIKIGMYIVPKEFKFHAKVVLFSSFNFFFCYSNFNLQCLVNIIHEIIKLFLYLQLFLFISKRVKNFFIRGVLFGVITFYLDILIKNNLFIFELKNFVKY